MQRVEHSAFVIGLGFVAGFIDVFGFTTLGGLLPAHVTGNLVFLAIDLAHHQYHVILNVIAVPIFCAAVMASAWFIGALAERRRDPFLPALLLEAALLFCAAIGLIALPPALNPNDETTIIVGTFTLMAMALQNTIMRLILNNLPPSTVMTGNITQVLSDTVAHFCHFRSISRTTDQRVILERQAKRMLMTVLSFLGGCLVAGFSAPWIGAASLIFPILAILGLVGFGRRTLGPPPVV
ncbi:YoaK family protein [Acidisoma cladoniae]|uniref:YoaK family protein n=1 Tax=Acidisoma cladoniae TaxID=3040935 RepID=UPI00254D5439|nr:YoaK family protein [Acidisoma sp. PAMC 29798]